MAVGGAGIVWLLPGSRHVAGADLDVHTLAYCAVAVMVGFQSVVFSASAKIFGITEGLLPASSRMLPLFRWFTLEAGLLAGAVLLAAGLAGAVDSVLMWQHRSFGRLDYADTMRVVIPSGMLIALGSQTILASFFMSLLGLKRGENPVA